MAEQEIVTIIESRVKALHDQDVEAAIAHYADDILICDLAPPLSPTGE